MTSLHIDFEMLQDSIDFKGGFKSGNYQQIVQFCTSSDVLVGPYKQQVPIETNKK